MSLKRKIALAGGGFLVFILLLAALFAGACFYLPHYLERSVIPRLAAAAGLPEYAVNVRNIGLFNADLGALRIGPPENPALIVQSVQIDYSPRSLYRQEIEKITLSGVELYLDTSGGEFKLRGLKLRNIADARQRPAKADAAGSNAAPPLFVKNLALRNSQMIIAYQGQHYRIPVELDVAPQDAAYSLLNAAARLYLRGQKISADASVNRSQGRIAWKVSTTALDLDRLADITGRIAGLNITGEVSLQAAAEMRWTPWRLESSSASLTLHRGRITAGGIELQTAVSPQVREVPWQIDIVGTDINQWQITCGRFAMASPLPLTLEGLEAVVKTQAAGFEADGNFNFVVPSTDQSGVSLWSAKIRDPLPMQGRFEASYQNSAKWQVRISTDKTGTSAVKSVRLDAQPYAISFAPPHLNLAAEAAPASQGIKTTYALTAPEIRIESPSGSIYVPKLLLKGNAGLAEENEPATRVTFDLQAPNTGLAAEGAAIKIPEISISGKLNSDDNRHMKLNGVMEFAGGEGTFSGLNARLKGARGKIPFKWPVEGKIGAGSVSIAGVTYKDMNLGSINGSIRQTQSGFSFEGGHQNKIVPDLKLDFSGESKLFNVAAATSKIRIKASRPGDGPEIDLGLLFAGAQGFQINGRIDLNGDFVLDGRGFNGNLHADFDKGSLLSAKNKLALEGIRASLDFPELPRIRSAPGQQVQFDKFSLGDLVAEKGAVDFQIESERSILVEKMHFLWCEGHVETQSMRLSPGIEDYRVTFYCDRLNLAKVLEQFGAAAAEGRGTVNGRIPLQYANGKVSFNDGFLFSTPGDGGKIRITGSEILTAGVPPDTPQYVQMELASEALKDYDYSWAKLNITSQGEELLLQMQMDGKPAKTLPFVYRKDIGGFAKIEADAEGSKFQGIRLDVNFRLPLNKMLQYKELINMIKKSD